MNKLVFREEEPISVDDIGETKSQRETKNILGRKMRNRGEIEKQYEIERWFFVFCFLFFCSENRKIVDEQRKWV